MYEGHPTPKISKEDIVSAFKEGGKENSEALELLKAWREQEQEKVAGGGTALERMILTAEIEIGQTEILSDAGLFEEAYDTINDALELPDFAPTEELLQKARNLRNELETK